MHPPRTTYLLYFTYLNTYITYEWVHIISDDLERNIKNAEYLKLFFSSSTKLVWVRHLQLVEKWKVVFVVSVLIKIATKANYTNQNDNTICKQKIQTIHADMNDKI